MVKEKTEFQQILTEMSSLSRRHHELIPISAIVFFSFLSSSSEIHNKSPPKPSALLVSACNATQNPSFCLHALSAYNHTAEAADLPTLAEIALRLSVTNASNALLRLNHKLRRLNPSSTLPPMSQKKRNVATRVLKECIEAYIVVNASFHSAWMEVRDKEYSTANYDAMNVGDDASSCGKALVVARVRNGSKLQKLQSDLLCFADIGVQFTMNLTDSP